MDQLLVPWSRLSYVKVHIHMFIVGYVILNELYWLDNDLVSGIFYFVLISIANLVCYITLSVDWLTKTLLTTLTNR